MIRSLPYYMLPPVQYPDDNYYLKIGGSRRPYKTLSTFEARRDWFHTSGDVEEGQELKEILLSIVPNLKTTSFHTKPCVITHTPTNRPFIDVIEDGAGDSRLFVAAGGCGSAAKSSNEIGHIAAKLVERNSLDYDLKADLFKTSYLA